MKKVLSLILAATLIIGLIPTVFAEDAETGNGNEWVFNLASHGLTEECGMATNNVTPFTLGTTVADISDKWEYINQASSSTRNITKDYLYWTKRNQTDAPVFNPDDNSTTNAIIFELVPDTSGTFNPSLSYISSDAAASYDVYFFEKPHDTWKVSSSMTDGINTVRKQLTAYIQGKPSTYIGNFDAYGDGTLKIAGFPKMTVTAGKSYYFVLIANGRNENWVSADSGNPTIELKLISFALKGTEISAAPVYEYNITTDSLTDTTATYSSGTLHTVTWETEGMLNLTKTDEFALLGRTAHDATQIFNSIGAWVETPVYANSTDYYKSESFSDRPYYAVMINVPNSGKYKLSLVNRVTQEVMNTSHASYKGRGAVTRVHIAKKTFSPLYTNKRISNYNLLDTALEADSTITFAKYYNTNTLATADSAPAITEMGEVQLDRGEYFVILDITEETFAENSECYWRYSDGRDKRQYIALSGIELTPVDDNDYDEIQSSYDSIVNVNPGNAVEKTPASTTSNVQILSSVNKRVLDTKDVSVGTEITYTAPEETGYTFLYWAQGIGDCKKIVSYDAKLSLKAEKGPMWLTAVYSDNSATKTDVIFYNANGDEISRSQYEENIAIDLADLPSMAGFGKAIGWTLDKDSKTYTSEDEIKASGKLMRFVAEYADEPSEKFAITVVGGTADNATPAYGDTVKVTATLRNGSKLFNYWMRDGEIVSFDLSYSFKAYKDTTVTAVYNDYLPVADTIRKIIIGTRTVGNETAAVAEFIGISDAVEKGILFGTNLDDATHKVSMKTDGDTFSVIDDVDGEAIGYAILANGNVIYSK